MGRDMSRRAALARYLDTWRGARVRPGEIDCAQFLSGWVGHLRGTDPGAAFKGTYSTLEQGVQRLADQGFDGLDAIVAAHLDRVPGWPWACDGDVAILRVEGHPGGQAGGLIAGGFVHVLGLRGGLDARPRDAAWRVYRP